MVSHAVRRTMRRVLHNQERCVILHINPPYEEVAVFKTFPKGSAFTDVVGALDYTTPAYLSCWFTYDDKNGESNS